jgi:anti-sigma factor RsiW
MKTFEERFTAWVDGQLAGDALADFEKELAAHPEAAGERDSALKLGDFLRSHSTAPSLSNPDFFNLQLQRRIDAEMPARPEPVRAERETVFSIFSRLAWGGVAFLVLAGVSFFLTIPRHSSPARSDYFAQVVEAWPSDPSISATTVYNPADNVTVLWLDGLDYVPSEQLALK